MTPMGYGVTKDGVPTGIWPRPLKSASDYAAKTKHQFPASLVEIVPIFVGGVVAPLPPTPPTELRHG